MDDIVLYEEDDEDIKNDFDVCRWGVEDTPAMQKEFEILTRPISSGYQHEYRGAP